MKLKNLSWFLWPVLLIILVGFWRWISEGSSSAGQRLYTSHCANCHMPEGEGLRNLIPPLAASDYLINQADELACIIRNGQRGQIIVNGTAFNQPMPANPALTAAEIRSLVNFIRNSWGNRAPEMTYSEITDQLKTCLPKEKETKP